MQMNLCPLRITTTSKIKTKTHLWYSSTIKISSKLTWRNKQWDQPFPIGWAELCMVKLTLSKENTCPTKSCSLCSQTSPSMWFQWQSWAHISNSTPSAAYLFTDGFLVFCWSSYSQICRNSSCSSWFRTVGLVASSMGYLQAAWSLHCFSAGLSMEMSFSSQSRMIVCERKTPGS